MAMINELSILPGERSGTVTAPASKSVLHRLLICAALGDAQKRILHTDLSEDILATVNCLRALGAETALLPERIIDITPIRKRAASALSLHAVPAHLPCGESGSTLRFLLPVCGALGQSAVFQLEGRLPERPIRPLAECLCAHGMRIECTGNTILCSGSLSAGKYEIPGDISSQFISGLLFALPLLRGRSELSITGKTESSPYIEMTLEALQQAGIAFSRAENEFHIPGGQSYALPEILSAEGDWSNAALFLCMGALSRRGITVTGLPLITKQGDREVLNILRRFGAEVQADACSITVRRGQMYAFTADASATPDLVPALAVLAAGAAGESRIINASRLRLKESDRLAAAVSLLSSLGGSAEETADGIIIHGTGSLRGGSAATVKDHRIVMASALAASLCREKVCVSFPECVDKSFPKFWECLDTLAITPVGSSEGGSEK